VRSTFAFTRTTGATLQPVWPLIGGMAVLGLSANEPTALLVVLVVLRSGRDRGAAFLAGWVIALVVVATGAGFVARIGLGPRPGGPRRVTLVIELVIGVALVAWASWYWLRNRDRAHSVEVPRILSRLTSIRRTSAFLVGVATATYPPAIIAGTTLLRSDASTVARVIGLTTFVAVGSVMVAAPVVAAYAAPAWAGRRSDAVFDWTLRHRRILLTVILIAVGSFVAIRAVLHLARMAN
jgi:Sap, sulfolipid-1-addressing protein